jgi:hypothetical protein
MNDIFDQIPSNDTGAETLQRYRYQAQIALPFCLECAFEGRIRSVIMEHFEDIVVEYEDYWHFIQVKSRNADRGDWAFGETLEALKSLYRAFQETSTLNAKYSLFVEGNLSNNNSLKELKEVNSKLDSTLITEVTNKPDFSR